MQFLAEKMHPLKMEFRDYIQALEHERSKIQVFHKELPLSLELVSHAIEACKQQLSTTTTEYNLNGQSECSVQISSDEVPIFFEEFMPIKKRSSPDYDDDDEDDHDEHHSHKQKVPKDNKSNGNDNKKKSDWLRSVQLWNHDPPSTKEDVPRRASVVEVKRNGGGAFQPFHRDESSTVGKANDASNDKAPSSPQVPSTSSTGPVTTGDNVDGSIKKEEKGQRKQRRCWSQELHKRFLHALQQLGGAATATPKQIRDLMKVDGLTNDEVKSHLQKFRLHNRRPNSMVHNNAHSQATPLFLVGNILFQPPEYAAAVATSSGELTTVTAPSAIYTPVASHPQAVTHTTSAATPSIKKLQFKQSEVPQHSNSEGRANQSEGAGNSNSPASSSSTHTTTTSPSS